MNQLSGQNTTVAGIISIIMGGLGAFTQIWGAIHGGAIDPTQLTSTVGAIVAGAGLIHAADAKQK